MHIVISIPAIEDFPKGVPHFWLNRMFIGSVTGDPQVNALSTTFVRLVESALIDYRQAREAVFEFWADSGFPLGIMHLAISRYEACVSDMSRAVRCFRRLRRHESLPEELRMALNVVRPRFVADQIYERLSNLRNEVQHLEDHIINGKIEPTQTFTLRPDGPEEPHPTDSGQTVKTVDRLRIGGQELLISDLAIWLVEMAVFAGKIADHRPAGGTGAKS